MNSSWAELVYTESFTLLNSFSFLKSHTASQTCAVLCAHSPQAKYKVKSVLGCVFTKFSEDQQNWFLEILMQNSIVAV